MNIVLHWWYLSIILFLFPFIYSGFRPSSSGYDLQFDTLIIMAVCWPGCIFFTLAKLL